MMIISVQTIETTSVETPSVPRTGVPEAQPAEAWSGERPFDMTAFGDVLQKPLAENAALGEALQSIVSRFSSDVDRVVEVTAEAEAQPVSAKASSVQPTTVADSDALSIEVPVREAPVVENVVSKKAPVEEADLTNAPSADALVAAGVMPRMVVPQEAAVPQAAATDGVGPVTAVSSASGGASSVLLKIAAEVADAILVTPGLQSGQGEVRVQLKPDVLSGTEVRVVVTGRDLGVEFAPVVHDAAVFIERNLSQLTQHLASRISVFNVSVSVRSDLKRNVARV